MRISDWSSDVCSSDLLAEQLVEGHRRVGGANHRNHDADQCDAEESVRLAVVTHSHDSASTHADDGDEVDHHNKSEQRGEQNPVLHLLPLAALVVVLARHCHQPASPTPESTLPSQTPGASSPGRSEEHTSELQSLMRISYAVFCLNKQNSTY